MKLSARFFAVATHYIKTGMDVKSLGCGLLKKMPSEKFGQNGKKLRPLKGSLARLLPDARGTKTDSKNGKEIIRYR
jgi:hypothetical protein